MELRNYKETDVEIIESIKNLSSPLNIIKRNGLWRKNKVFAKNRFIIAPKRLRKQRRRKIRINKAILNISKKSRRKVITTLNSKANIKKKYKKFAYTKRPKKFILPDCNDMKLTPEKKLLLSIKLKEIIEAKLNKINIKNEKLDEISDPNTNTGPPKNLLHKKTEGREIRNEIKKYLNYNNLHKLHRCGNNCGNKNKMMRINFNMKEIDQGIFKNKAKSEIIVYKDFSIKFNMKKSLTEPRINLLNQRIEVNCLNN